jgi:hypothetical protein
VHLNDILGIFSAIVVLAIVATVVQSPNSSKIIGAWTTGFGTDVRAARGN